MKLYVTHLGRWAGTQADIKPLGKEDGGWVEREVPTDKAGLIAWLNDNEVGTPATLTPLPSFADEDISDLLGDDYKTIATFEPTDKEGLIAYLNEYPDDYETIATFEPASKPALHLPAPRVSTTQDVIDWVLDVATPPQIEGLFAALGARFHEAVKGQDND